MVATGEGSDAAPLSEAPKPAAKPAAKPVAESAASAQPSTPKLDLSAKLSGKSSARVAVAKTDTTASAAATETQNEPAATWRSDEIRKAGESAEGPASRGRARQPAGADASGRGVARDNILNRLGRSTRRAELRGGSQEHGCATPLEIRVGAERLCGRGAQSCRQWRDDLSFSRRRPVESRRSRFLRAPERRRRRVLHRQIVEGTGAG